MQWWTEFLKIKQFNIRKVRIHKKGKKPKIYNDDIFTFDIETTSAFINEHGNVIRYHKGRSSDYWKSLEPISLCYIWQFSYNDTVYYGRELTDFVTLLKHLPPDAKTIIWVHNLSFEAHFLMNILNDLSMFARQPHKPMKLTSGDFPNIEFRCTYMLTRLKLETWGNQLGVPKKTGDLKYNRIRTPKTVLTDTELGYCERDCIVVYAGIKKYLETYKTLDKIPLTQTGTVRAIVKARLTYKDSYNHWIKKLVPKNAEQYKMLRELFAGGYTHANVLYVNEVQDAIIDNVITHRDFTSSYPTWMIAGKYPCTQWAYTGLHTLPDESTFDDYGYIMLLRFTNIRATTYNTYIQYSKAHIFGKCEKDNGRVRSADLLTMYVTEVDYLTIRDSYKWDDVEVIKLYKSKKEYLPKELVSYVLELFQNKCKYDGVVGMEDIYLKSKERINSLFGMMVTALIQSDVEFDDETKEWCIGDISFNDVNAKLDQLRAQWRGNKKYFLNYSWGIWVTAYARRALWLCILHGDNDYHTIYCDTDSIFIHGNPDFEWYDKYITDLLVKACNHHNINPDLLTGVKPNGSKKQLGLFTKEKDVKRFCTLGAKRYVEERFNGKLYLTVAGINKGAVNCLHGDIENFNRELEFDKDHNGVSKLLTTYCTNQPTIKYPDGYVSNYKCGINLRPTGYSMRGGKEFTDLLELADHIREVSQNINFQNHLRGRFNE